MPYPVNLVLIRHGHSEANLVQKSAPGFTVPEAFLKRHDSYARLTELGIEQANNAGNYLREHGYTFDRFYVSPHLRTRETAANLCLNGQWVIDDLWRERDWGEFGMNPMEDIQAERFPYNAMLKMLHPWYWKPTGGESLATGVRARANLVLQHLKSLEDVDTVIGVTHGEFIRTMQFVLERLTPDEWVRLDNDKSRTIKNCSFLHYTRRNPKTGELSYRYNWVKQVNTQDPSLSPDNGDWREIVTTKFSDQDLLRDMDNYPPLFR
jgi:broad specificity phosphatase PhoE